MKTIQEILNEYNVELKKVSQQVTVYTCRKIGQKDKLTASKKQLNTFCDAAQPGNFITLND